MPAAIFLDRDGTVIPDKHYLNDPQQVELLPGAAEGLLRLQKAGFLLVIVTNQSGIERGLVQEENLPRIHQRLDDLLAVHQVKIHAYYYCPSADDQHPDRKPNPGMLLKAAKDHHIDLTQSWMIGDKDSDLVAGVNAGTQSLGIDPTKKWNGSVANLQEVADRILNSGQAL